MNHGVCVTDHVKSEWARFANAAYASGHNFIGHRFSAKAALPHGFLMRENVFDTLQRQYRDWLVFGNFSKLEIVDEPSAAEREQMGINVYAQVRDF